MQKKKLVALAIAFVLCSALYIAAADQVLRTYYAPDPRIVPAAVDLTRSATGTINFAANTFTDDRIAAGLVAASTRSVAVTAVLDITNGTSAVAAGRKLTAAGIPVYYGKFPDRIENHVFTVDGGTSAAGNYYWSPTAVQPGNHLAIIGGTATASKYNATFGSLQTSSTLATP
jgi:hypothetical protein